MVLTFTTLPLETNPVAFHISGRRPQYNKPETNGPNYWATRLQDSITRLSDANYDCFERIQEKFKIFITLSIIIYPKTTRPRLYKLSFPLGVGRSSSDTSLLCSPLSWLKIKAIFLFPRNSACIFFFQHQWAEKSKILLVTRACQGNQQQKAQNLKTLHSG